MLFRIRLSCSYISPSSKNLDTPVEINITMLSSRTMSFISTVKSLANRAVAGNFLGSTSALLSTSAWEPRGLSYNKDKVSEENQLFIDTVDARTYPKLIQGRYLPSNHHTAMGIIHPSTPLSIGWLDLEDEGILQAMNRNARYGKKANRGKRPVSRQRRRSKARAYGNPRR